VRAEDVLFTLAQIAAAFAGFGGIVAALGRPLDWRLVHRHALPIPESTRNLYRGVTVRACSRSARRGIGRTPYVWALSGAAQGLFTLGNLVAARLGARPAFSLNPKLLRRWMAVLSTSVQVAICLARFANTFGWPFNRGGMPYLSSIFVFSCSLVFVLLALDSTPREPNAI
jgi:hypothetical protein